jgi:cob(II)yrinic acid a,c-diamide reductase
MVGGDQFKNAMRAVAGSVVVVTVGVIGQRTGLTATSLVSLTVEPPTLLVCVNKSASAHDRILSQRTFAVNVLDEDGRTIADAFAGRSRLSGEQRFADGMWTVGKTGVPLLTRSIVSFECKVAAGFIVDSHTLFVGEVVHAEFNKPSRPLMYVDGKYASVAHLGTDSSGLSI